MRKMVVYHQQNSIISFLGFKQIPDDLCPHQNNPEALDFSHARRSGGRIQVMGLDLINAPALHCCTTFP